MGYFKSIRQSIGSYMPSAAMAQQQASNEHLSVPPGATSSKARLQLDAEPVSPTSRTTEWLRNIKPKKSSKDAAILFVKGNRVAKSSAQSPSRKIVPRIEFWGLKYLSEFIYKNEGGGVEVKEEKDEFDGDTLLPDILTASDELEDDTVLEDVPTAESPGDELEGYTLLEDLPIKTEDELEGDSLLLDVRTAQFLGIENDATIIQDEDDGEDAGSTLELEEETDDYDGWTEDEIWLFEKLNMRGFEPLLHLTWALDFPTLIPELYTMDESKVFIKTVSGNDCQACRALEGLNLLAARVRDRAYHAKLPTESIIYKQVKSYYDWSMKDAGLANFEHIPIVSIVAARLNEPVTSVVDRLTIKLKERGRQYRAKWLLDDDQCSIKLDHSDEEGDEEQQALFKYELPTLYGIVIKSTVIAFVTYDVANPERPVKSLALFDFQHQGQDVWHGLAIAILFVHARNYLLQLKEDGELDAAEIQKEVESTDDDPDA